MDKKYIVMASMTLQGIHYSTEEYSGKRYTPQQWDEAQKELEEALNDSCVDNAYITTV